MARLTFIEKEIIYRLFGIGNGYLFNYVKGYTKTISKNIILDACNINIYEDEEFKDLSQQKCFEKICNEKGSVMTAKLLRGLCDYFCFKNKTGDGSLSCLLKWYYFLLKCLFIKKFVIIKSI